jgi:hypothetical protein
VEWALHVDNRTAPFHWRRWGQGKKKEVRAEHRLSRMWTILILSSQGLFETSLIAYAYVSHLVALKAVPSCYEAKSDSKSPPIAALILCIQAVRRKHIVSSRTYWTTG